MFCFGFFLMDTGLLFRLSQLSAKFSAPCLGCDAATTETCSIQNKQHSTLSAGAVFWHHSTVIEAEGGTIERVVLVCFFLLLLLFPLTPPQMSPFVAAAACSCSNMMVTHVLSSTRTLTTESSWRPQHDFQCFCFVFLLLMTATKMNV